MTLPVDNDTKERLSLAYVRAIAARVGCYVEANEGSDLASIDATIVSVRQPRRMISLQLKATASDLPATGPISFDLPIKNYNDLRQKQTTAPQALVIVNLPVATKDWLHADSDCLTMRRAAWWLDLWGQPDSQNSTSVRVTIPRIQLFDVSGLQRLLHAAAQIAAGAQRKPMNEY